jgi:hypothetical protein
MSLVIWYRMILILHALKETHFQLPASHLDPAKRADPNFGVRIEDTDATRTDAHFIHTESGLIANTHIYLCCTAGFGVISSESVEEGFRAVDRRLFVPRVSW